MLVFVEMTGTAGSHDRDPVESVPRVLRRSGDSEERRRGRHLHLQTSLRDEVAGLIRCYEDLARDGLSPADPRTDARNSQEDVVTQDVLELYEVPSLGSSYLRMVDW